MVGSGDCEKCAITVFIVLNSVSSQLNDIYDLNRSPTFGPWNWSVCQEKVPFDKK